MSTKKLLTSILATSMVFSFLCSPIARANGNPSHDLPAGDASPKYVPGEVLVKYKKGSINLETSAGRMKAKNFGDAKSLSIEEHLQKENVSVLKITDAQTVEDKITELKNDPNIEYAEPNYTREISTISSNDTDKALLWGLDNTGQTINGDWGNITGTADADVDAPEAWAINEGTNADVIVAVIDIGVLYTHPDLINNMWDGTNCKSNTGATIVGGCLHGFDYQSSTSDNNPLPSNNSNYHGTHVAGIIGAVKDNNQGVIGIAPHAKIMAIRFALTVSSEVKAIDFAIQNGAKIINASFGGGGFSQAEYDAISRFRDAGGLFFAAAGNDGTSNDISHFYPSDYDLDNIISVAATDQNDAITSFSDFGATSVDVGAPGENILSTMIVENTHASSVLTPTYDYLSGTSMATPMTAGLAALIWGYKNNLTAAQVKNLILNDGDVNTDLNGVTVSGKRINAQRSLFGADIISAQTIHDAATEGTGPGDVAVDSKATYQTAIDAAALIASNSSASSSFIADGVSALDAATGIFVSGIVPSDFTALNSAIASAQTLHDGATESTTPGDYVVGSKVILQTAIDTASAVPGSASQSTIDAALATLNAAVNTFNASIVPPSDISALTTAITNAQTIHDAATEGILAGQYAVDSKATLQSAIDTASAITNAVSQGTVDTAIVTLNDALTTFQNRRVNPTITASAGSNGTISPSGAVTVTYGSNQTFTITKNSGYSIDSVTVDDVSVGTGSMYEFDTVTADHTISVTFKKNISSGGGGGGGGGGGSVAPPEDMIVPVVTPIINPLIPTVIPADCLPGYLFSPSTGKSCGVIAVPGISVPLINPTPGTSTAFIFSRVLKFGMTGDDVTSLQKYLNIHGYPVAFSGTGSKGFESRYFGMKTTDAVKAFQRAHGLVSDGAVGPKTAGIMK